MADTQSQRLQEAMGLLRGAITVQAAPIPAPEPPFDVPRTTRQHIDSLLTPIEMQVDLLLSGHLGPLSEAQQRSAQILARSVWRLREMVHAARETTW